SILYFADVCAGPGGFSEYLLWRRCNATAISSECVSPNPDESNEARKSCEIDTPDLPCLNVKGFGMTLTGSCDFREGDFQAGPPEAFLAHYGPEKDGDITKWSNLASFAALVDRGTNHAGVHILVADGGFDVSGAYNLQEVLSKRIYLGQCLCALIVLQPGGHFLTKLFDTFTEFSVGLIYLMSQVFEEIMIIKPITSRPANSERYLLCKNFLSPCSRMAGCPAAPVKVNAKSDNAVSGSVGSKFRQKAQKLPGHDRHLHNPLLARGSESDKEFGVLNRDEAGVVGELIEHFLAVNEALGVRELSKLSAGNTSKDVLRLCSSKAILRDERFLKFITTMNQEFAQAECVALSKLLTFAHNLQLSESRQSELKTECLERWKIGSYDRKPVPWPITSANRSVVIHSVLGDREMLKSLNMLPKEYCPNPRVRSCSEASLSQLDYFIPSRIALVCAAPSMSASSELSQPMLIYSRGSHHGDIHCTIDGDHWTRLDQMFPLLKPRLPAGTLVWGQSTYEYAPKNGRRRYALMIFDVACIYGRDCYQLPYRKRMELAERMVDVVNFPGMYTSYLRVAPLIRMQGLPAFIDTLPVLPCKDAAGPVRMYVHPDGMAFQPHSVLLLRHLVEPWTEALSRSTGRIYYFNHSTTESTFDLPISQHCSFTQTQFIRVPCTSTHPQETNVAKLVQLIELFCQNSQD
ncbi:Ribosomal RNA large subunit methyltransferase J, partial [Paragonimus heterotremus]